MNDEAKKNPWTLNQVLNDVEKLFDEIGTVADQFAPKHAAIVCSGALGLPGHPPPGLFASPELAVLMFKRTLLDWAWEQTVEPTKGEFEKYCLTWVGEPRLITFDMTLKDQSGVERIASTRYAVYSRAFITGARVKPDVAKPAGPAAAPPV